MRDRKTGRFIIVLITIITCMTGVVLQSTTPSAKAKKATVAPADGAALFGSNCAICHARNGTGTPAWRATGQPDLSSPDWQKTHSDEQIATRIRDGKGKMPGFRKKFSDEDISALVKQVRALKKK